MDATQNGLKKIYNIFKRSRKEQKCPECESAKVSIVVDTINEEWYAFCEVCGTKGARKDLIDMKSKRGV